MASLGRGWGPLGKGFRQVASGKGWFSANWSVTYFECQVSVRDGGDCHLSLVGRPSLLRKPDSPRCASRRFSNRAYHLSSAAIVDCGASGGVWGAEKNTAADAGLHPFFASRTAAALAGGWKLMDRILDWQREHESGDELEQPRSEYEEA